MKPRGRLSYLQVPCWTPYWARRIQFSLSIPPPPHLLQIHFPIIPIHAYVSQVKFPLQDFKSRILSAFSFFHARCISHQSYSPWLDHPKMSCEKYKICSSLCSFLKSHFTSWLTCLNLSSSLNMNNQISRTHKITNTALSCLYFNLYVFRQETRTRNIPHWN
jgi:hypothetical protein